jgi:hypothetical protein
MTNVETYVDMMRMSTYGMVPLEAITSGTIEGAWERVIIRQLKLDVGANVQACIDLFVDHLGLSGVITYDYYLTAAQYIIAGGKKA